MNCVVVFNEKLNEIEIVIWETFKCRILCYINLTILNFNIKSRQCWCRYRSYLLSIKLKLSNICIKKITIYISGFSFKQR